MSNWVSVKRQLPEQNCRVLVIVSGYPKPRLAVCNMRIPAVYNGERWIIEGYEHWENANPSVWRPYEEGYNVKKKCKR